MANEPTHPLHSKRNSAPCKKKHRLRKSGALVEYVLSDYYLYIFLSLYKTSCLFSSECGFSIGVSKKCIVELVRNAVKVQDTGD